MHNEFMAIVERDGEWHIATVLRSRARMGTLSPLLEKGGFAGGELALKAGLCPKQVHSV